ncbi:hypothetical protein [Pseudoneobacillus sp. C159]
MWLLIGLILSGTALGFGFKYIVLKRAIGIDSGALIKAESLLVTCTNCHARMKRQKYGHQCPSCKKSF